MDEVKGKEEYMRWEVVEKKRDGGEVEEDTDTGEGVRWENDRLDRMMRDVHRKTLIQWTPIITLPMGPTRKELYNRIAL